MDANELIKILKENGFKEVIQRNQNIMACCPVHEERRPSWGISLEPPYFHGCFACGFKGTLYSLLRYRLNFSESAALRIAGRSESSFDFSGMLVSARKYGPEVLDYRLLYAYPTISTETVGECLGFDYAYKRGINRKGMKEAGLRFDKVARRVLFPWYYRGDLVGVTGRLVGEIEGQPKTLPYFSTKKSQCLYFPYQKDSGFPDKHDSIVLAEGEIDALRLRTCGFNAAALGFGSFSRDQEQVLLDTGCKIVIIAFDDDERGQSLTEDVRNRLRDKFIVKTVDYGPFSRKLEYKYVKLDPGVLRETELKSLVMTAKRFSDWPTF